MPIIHSRPTTIVAFSGNDIDLCHDSDPENRVCESIVLGMGVATTNSSLRVLPFRAITDFDTNVRLEFTDPRQVEQVIEELKILRDRLMNAPGPGQEKLNFTHEEERE